MPISKLTFLWILFPAAVLFLSSCSPALPTSTLIPMPTETAKPTTTPFPTAKSTPARTPSVQDVLPYQSGDPVLPLVLQGQIGDLTIQVIGSTLTDNWPWPDVTCTTPAFGSGDFLILRIIAKYPDTAPYSLLFGEMEPIGTGGGFHSAFPIQLLPLKGWWSSVGLKDGAEWLVFQLPEGLQPKGLGPGSAFTILSEETAYRDIDRAPALESYRPYVDWLVTSYPEGTRLWNLASLTLVVLDPYTGQWGSLPIPELDAIPEKINPESIVCIGGSILP